MSQSRILTALHAFRAACQRSPAEALLAQHFSASRRQRVAPTPAAPLIAVGAPADIAYYAILGKIVSGLCRHQALRTEQIDTQSLRPGAAHSLRRFLRARLDFNSLTRRKWEGLYGAFCDRVGYRTTDWIGPMRALRQWREAWSIWRALHDKDQLATLHHGGILIGDLVIDTYLRLRPTTTLALNDRYLLVVIRQALKDIDLAFDYFRRRRPAAFLSIYTTYLQHGIPIRVALACGVKSLTFGNLQEFCTQVSPAHLNQTKPSARYSADFSAMSQQADKISQASQALEARLSGRIDPATAYMKQSAYAVTTRQVPDVKGATVIFLHDFYDSVHIYSWILFHDFWEWACFTIETLQAAGHDFWIKPHPNQGAQSSTEIDALKRKYPGLKFLGSDITNRQLVDAGMACAVTVYGSVAAEMAFLGVRSISCGDSPHASFDAFYLARSRQDYARMLSDPPASADDAERLKAQACAFYYMHNLDLDEDGLLLRDRFVALWTHMMKPPADGCFSRAETDKVLDALTDNAAFQHFSENLLSPNLS